MDFIKSLYFILQELTQLSSEVNFNRSPRRPQSRYGKVLYLIYIPIIKYLFSLIVDTLQMSESLKLKSWLMEGIANKTIVSTTLAFCIHRKLGAKKL